MFGIEYDSGFVSLDSWWILGYKFETQLMWIES